MQCLKRSFLVFALVCLGLLACGYGLQYFFSFRPCVLCLYERWPSWAGAALGTAGFLASPRGGRPLVWGLFVVFLGASILSLYHVLVEAGMVPALAACHGPDFSGKNFAETKALLLATPLANCEAPSFFLFGLSLASYNLLLSLGLMFGTGWSAWRCPWKRG